MEIFSMESLQIYFHCAYKYDRKRIVRGISVSEFRLSWKGAREGLLASMNISSRDKATDYNSN